MGWFDGVSEVGSSSHKHHKSSSSHKSKKHHSSSNSIFGGDNASRGSIFGGGDNHGKHNSSRASFFGFNNSPRSSSSSHYKRSPRAGYMTRIYHKLRRLLRDLKHYMKKNPMKVFMLVIMPLITGGALTTLLAKFGIRLPRSVEKLFTAAGGSTGGNAGYGGMPGGYGVGRGSDGGLQYERTRSEGSFDMNGLGGLGAGLLGSMGGIGGAVSLAKMFM